MNRQRYDVLVIGSGMGGMCAAALLAHEGLKTLVVEKLSRIGGRCSTMDYKGFKCITGVLGVEIGGMLEAVFRRLGAEFNVIPAGPPHYLINGEIYELPPYGGLKKLLSVFSHNQMVIERILTAFSNAMGGMESDGEMSLKDWVLQYSGDEEIMKVFHAMVAPTLFVNADEISAREYFRYITKLRGIRDWGFCPEGSISLPRALLKVLRNKGGKLWRRSSVKTILSEKGVVRGAELSKEGRSFDIKADIVISNAGPKKTVALAGRENFDRGYLEDLERRLRPAMAMDVHIAGDEPFIDLDYLVVTGTRRVHSVYEPTNVCPELAPKGKHLFIAAGGPASSLSPLDKRRELELCMMDLKDLIPGFDTGARVLLSRCYYGGWPGMHAWPGRDMPQRTSISNLYNVGDGVKPSGTTALPGAVASAVKVVEDIMGSR